MIFIYILLGIIQGFTEPIPISSSGHLLIFKHLFDVKALNDINFEIFVNFGSLIAIIIFFRKDLVQIFKNFYYYIKTKDIKYYHDFKYFMLVVVGTIPACIVGFIFKNTIDSMSSNIKLIGFALLITAFFLYIIRNMKGSKSSNNISYKDAIKIGIFQAIALLPGISRSGATIVGGMLSNLKREAAFKFSFMLYIPISLATMIIGVKDTINSNIDINMFMCYILGMIASMIVTLFSVKWFKDIMKKGKLIYFVYYCTIVGILVILFM